MESSSSRREISDDLLALKALKRTNNKGQKIQGQHEQEHEKETRKRGLRATTQDQHDEAMKIKRKKITEQEEAIDTAKECEIKKRKRDREETLAVTLSLEEEKLAVSLEKKNKRKRNDEETLAVLLEKKTILKTQKAATSENEKKRRKERDEEAAEVRQKNIRKRKQEETGVLLLKKDKKRQKEQGEEAPIDKNTQKDQEQDAAAAQDKRTKRKREQEVLLKRKNKRREEVVCIPVTGATTSEPSVEKENPPVLDRRSKPEVTEVQVLETNSSSSSSSSSTREETFQGHGKRKSGAMMLEDMNIVRKKRSYTRRNLGKVSAKNNVVHEVGVKNWVLYDIPGPIPDMEELLMEFHANDKLFRNFFAGVPESD